MDSPTHTSDTLNSSTGCYNCLPMPQNSSGSSAISRRRSSLGHQSGCEALHDAVAKGKLHLTKFILDAVDRNRDVIDFQDEHGKTALIRACKIREMRTQLRMAELLLDRGASVNLKDNVGKTVLHYACELHANNLVKLLIKNAANPNLPDNDGCTPLILCARVGNDIGTEILVKCFRKLGLDIDHEDSEGLTALMTACKDGFLECSRILIHKGKASLDKKDKYNNMTAVDWARYNGCSEEEIAMCLKRPSVENMEFPDPKHVIEILNRKVQRENCMKKQKSELYIPELDMGGYITPEDSEASNGPNSGDESASSFSIGGRLNKPRGLSTSPMRRNSNIECSKIEEQQQSQQSFPSVMKPTTEAVATDKVIQGQDGRDTIKSNKSNSTIITTVDQPLF